MQFRAKQIAPPKEWGTFEDLCHALFKRVWGDPLAQKNGRRGQVQHGVDIFGSIREDRRAYVGVQCKGKDKNYGGKVDWSEVLIEVAKAEGFSPGLDRWILATTASVDGTLQQRARELSVERAKKGCFRVDVLGWEELQALLADAPEIVAEFYPEHADYIPQVIEALRILPSLEEKLAMLVEQGKSMALTLHERKSGEVWEVLTFEGGRSLGPALMGYPLGPADAAACPRLVEVDLLLKQLKIAFSARLVGEPGAGKSICAYQVAKHLSDQGFEVLRLIDPQADDIDVKDASAGRPRLYVLDDAHLLRPHSLQRLEDQARAGIWILSTHNTVEPGGYRGAITLDARRGVRTIAAALRADLEGTLRSVRVADDDVGERMMDADLGERIDQAEEAADRPWQFCFVLGGGWRRARQAADAARAVDADLVLGALAIRQVASRDARATPKEIAQVCAYANLSPQTVNRGLEWMVNHRLMISAVDCRTPHQRFAVVVLKRILEGQDSAGRKKIGLMIEGVFLDPDTPYAGVRVLAHELRFSGDYMWTRLIPQHAVDAVVVRCWTAQGEDRGFAALALSELCDFAEGSIRRVVGENVITLGQWISNPNDGAFGFGHFLNHIAQADRNVADKVVSSADPSAIANAFSDATPENAYGLAELLRSIASVANKEFNAKVKAALSREKLLRLAEHGAFLQQAFIFARFCATVRWWDENLGLEMAEAFIPTAQELLASDPIDGFHQLDWDLASSVLRVMDVLGVYVGKLKPTRREWEIAKRMCEKVNPKEVAQKVSSVRPRHFQSAGFFLDFLAKSAPRKYETVLRNLDWDKLDKAIGDDWANPSHETEVLLATLYSRSATRELVKKFISRKADSIVHFPPRLLLMVPEVGFAHLAKGGALRLAQHGHVSWELGGLALALVADAHPELLEGTVVPFVVSIASAVAKYSRDSTGPAEGFVRVLAEHAPEAWRGVLHALDPATAEESLSGCLVGDRDHRSTAALVVESAIALDGPIGDMARRLRTRFPKASVPATTPPRFSRRRRRPGQRRSK